MRFTCLLALAACTSLTPIEPPPPPQVLITGVNTDHVQLSRNSDSSEMRLTLDYSIDNGGDQSSQQRTLALLAEFSVRARVYVVDVETDTVVSELDNGIQALPQTTGGRRDQFTVDVVKLKLAPGSYTVQPIILVATASRIDDSLQNLYTDWLAGRDPDFSIATGKILGFQVLDDGPDAMAGYRTLIESGRPDHVLRGLSELVM